MSIWNDYSIEPRIREILDVEPRREGHHFGRPFLTASVGSTPTCGGRGLVKLLGSHRAAREWIADEDPAATARREQTWWKIDNVPATAPATIAPEEPRPRSEPSPQLPLWPEPESAEVSERTLRAEGAAEGRRNG